MYDDDLVLVCVRCGSRKAAIESDQQALVTCTECAFTAQRAELLDTARARAIQDVDDALERVRSIKRRFPDR